MSNNQINFSINISDELLDKILTVMALSNSSPTMGGMPMQLMALAQGGGGKSEPAKKKPQIGFGRHENGEKVTKATKEG